MTDIPKHIRIFNPAPDDDFVTKRTASINAIENAIKKKTTVSDLLKFAEALLNIAVHPEQANVSINEIAEPALKKQSPAFVADGEQIQLSTCTLLATTQFLEKFKGHTSKLSPEVILSIALWSGLSYQEPQIDKEKFEILRSELLIIVREIVGNIGVFSRTRKDTPLRTALTVPSDNSFITHVANVNASDGKLIDDLRFNAILDREEIDVLWWVLAGWSSICKSQLTTLNPVQVSIVSAIEISGLLKRIPAEAHAHLSCRLLAKNDLYNGDEIIEQLGILTTPISEFLSQHDLIKNNPMIFPAFNLLTGVKCKGVESKRELIEWTTRLLLEGSLLNLNRLSE